MNQLKLKKRNDSVYHTYGKLTTFLNRKGITHGSRVATFLLDKFSNVSTVWVNFYSQELIDRGIIEKGDFTEWRDTMIKKGLLIWEGSLERNKDGNFQSSRYKPGDLIVKYINEEKSKNDVIATMRDLDALRKEFDEKYGGISKALLNVFPPDTPQRRQIIFENCNDEKKILELLKEN